jgi:hypothetical protein
LRVDSRGAFDGLPCHANLEQFGDGLDLAFDFPSVPLSVLLLYFALFETRSFHSSKTPGFKATAV